jgi:uncharacterized protein YcfJ
MKKLLLAGTASLLMTAPAFAESVTAKVEDHYREVTRQIPSTEKICETVEVPIYGTVQGQASTGDTVVGAIIGGAIGNQIGNGSGRDAATVLGAIVGADIANKRGGTSQQVITGYRQEQRCHNRTTYTTKTENVYSHSSITWTENGRRLTLEFQR